MSIRMFLRVYLSCALVACACSVLVTPAQAQNAFVPGSGTKVEAVGDDFEAEDWVFHTNLPKSSRNIDGNGRFPLGGAKNGRLIESAYRGTPDVIERVATPAGGLPGSKGAMLMKTLHTGIPGRPSNESQQDDLLVNVASRVGSIPISMQPSFVVRVYVPPFEEWDQRNDSSLGIRAALTTTKTTRKKTLFFSRTVTESEEYWPGFFIAYHPAAYSPTKQNSASILIRGNEYGHEVGGGSITETGWWTFGMSFSADGWVHYYASPGVDDLQEKDRITTQLPYGYKAERFSTFFFNVVTADNARNWSTTWIIDDPTLYTRVPMRR